MDDKQPLSPSIGDADRIDVISEGERQKRLEEELRLLHVHGPGVWHDDVIVYGNRNALVALRDAIDVALSSDACKSDMTATVRDGEGFSLRVELIDEPWTHPRWESAVLPYSDPIAQGRPDPLIAIVQLRQALRNANAALVKRGVRPVIDPTLD